MTGQETCWTLIRRAAGGDRSARSQFGRSYQHLIRSYLGRRWRGSALAADVEDAVQEVFMACLEDGGPLERVAAERGFRAFLLGVVRHVAQRFERTAVRRRETAVGGDSAFVAVADRERELAQHFDRQWALAMVQEARHLIELAARTGDPRARLHAQLLELRFEHDLPVRAIAARWQMDADAVHRAYAKARERFRDCLRKVVAFHAVPGDGDLDAECQRVLAALGEGAANA